MSPAVKDLIKEIFIYNEREKQTVSYILGRYQDQGPRKICWAMAMLSAMEYMLARVNPADNELSVQVLVYTLWAHLRGRNLPQAPNWKIGYEVPLLEVFRWMMVYGVGKESEYETVYLNSVSFFFFFSSFFVMKIYVNNNKKMIFDAIMC